MSKTFEQPEGRASVNFSPEIKKSKTGKDLPNLRGDFKLKGVIYSFVGWLKDPNEFLSKTISISSEIGLGDEKTLLKDQGELFISYLMPFSEIEKNRNSEKVMPEIKIILRVASEPDVTYEIPLWATKRKSDGTYINGFYTGSLKETKEYQTGEGNASQLNQDSFHDDFNQTPTNQTGKEPDIQEYGQDDIPF